MIHLKEESDSMYVLLRIAADEVALETGGTAILKADRPDDTELFIVLPIAGMDEEYIMVELTSDEIAEMTTVPGVFEGTISIIDSENTISREDYEDYDLITVQPFMLHVQTSAAL